MSSQGRGWVAGLLLIAVGCTASCTSASQQQETTETTPAAATMVSSAASHSGDPAIYAAAIKEIQSYLTMEVQHGPYAAAAAYLVPDEQPPVSADTTWPVPNADPQTPVLIAGSVDSFVPASWTSADQFRLYVTLDLHFRGDAGRANWSEGRNSRFFTFTRPTPEVRWRMYVATGP